MSCECAIYAINLFDYATIKYLVAENLYKSKKKAGIIAFSDWPTPTPVDLYKSLILYTELLHNIHNLLFGVGIRFGGVQCDKSVRPVPNSQVTKGV